MKNENEKFDRNLPKFLDQTVKLCRQLTNRQKENKIPSIDRYTCCGNCLFFKQCVYGQQDNKENSFSIQFQSGMFCQCFVVLVVEECMGMTWYLLIYQFIGNVDVYSFLILKGIQAIIQN
eukprot:TRINITY_DN19622_c0_g1_i2.p2 TRINITY_DN19622_c0_g1~~TRINITY_DN19622_c0_g1_i2.p2  ORF type:complete len:120 (-),score=4.14 TRINITY_DN19622_c0_g1_i2:125-484(-)